MSERKSLEDILGDTCLQVLNQPCQDEHLCELARHITKWPSLAAFMGIARPEVEQIMVRWPRDALMQRIDFLRSWKDKQGQKGTYRKLCKTFRKIGEVPLAEKVCDICSQKSIRENSSDESEEERLDTHDMSSASTSTSYSKVCSSETQIPSRPPPPPSDLFPPCEAKSKPRQVLSETAAVHNPTLQASTVEQVRRNFRQNELQFPPPPPSVLPPGVIGRSIQVKQRSSSPNPPSSLKVSVPEFGHENEAVVGLPNHPSPDSVSKQESYSVNSQLQPMRSAGAFPTPASLLTPESLSGVTEGLSHISSSPQTYCLPPSKRVKYSSLDLIASSQVGNSKETLTPSSTVPTPLLVRSSPLSPQLLPSYPSPPSIQVGEPGEGHLPPGYYLPSPGPMVTVTPNSRLPAAPTSVDSRSQPQEIQQITGYPHYETPLRADAHQTPLRDDSVHQGEEQPPAGYASMPRSISLPSGTFSASLPSLHARSQPENQQYISGYLAHYQSPMPSHMVNCCVPTAGHYPLSDRGPGSSHLYPQPHPCAQSPTQYNNLGFPRKQQIPSSTQNSQCVNPDQLDLFAEYLRLTYEVQPSDFLAIQWPQPFTRKVFNLSLIHSETIRYTAPNEELLRLLMTGCVPEYVRRNASIELKDIFEHESRGHNFVLIEGAPGSGKSTLAWYIIQKWTAQELFQEFKIVIFVQLRDPEIQNAQSLADILPTNSKETKAVVVTLIEALLGKGVLLVLDGWDEFSPGLQDSSFVARLIRMPQNLCLHFCTLLVTSRPIASAVLQPYASSRVEIVGFTPEEVRLYFQEALGDAVTAQNFQDQLKERPIIEASCYLPLNAAIVVHLFKELNQSLPTTLHGVFSALVCGCVVRHLRKESDGKQFPEIHSLEKIPPNIQQPFKNVCTLAYEGTLIDKVTFTHQDLSLYELLADLNVLSLMEGIQSFASRKSMLYHFLHLSVQELLAALHVSKLPQSEQVQVFTRLFNQPRFAAVFRFYAAFTKLQTEGIRDIVTSIVQSKETTHLLNLLHCVYEAQDSSLCNFVASQLNGNLDLSGCILSPLDCLSVGYFLSCVCQTTEGAFQVSLRGCTLNDYSVGFLVKELSKSDFTSLRAEGTAAHDALCGRLVLDLSDNDIEGGGFRCLSELISHSNVVSKLVLSHNKIQKDADGLAHLLQGLRTNTSIVKVRLEECFMRVTEDNGPLLVDMLRENTTLKILDFSYNPDLLTSGLGYIIKGLCCNVGILRLSLSHCNITGKEAKSLAKVLTENGTVESLDLSYNKLGNDGIFYISSSLKVNSTLQKLNLMNCSLSAEDINVLVESMLSNTSLWCLDLCYNPISDAGAAHIADFLKHNTRLTEVRLGGCGITGKGAQSLAAALREHISLEVIDLCGNNLLDAGVTTIAEALRHNQRLRDLNLKDCGLTDQGMESIATSLEINTTLEALDMSWNDGVTNRGLLTLGESLKKNKGLRTLELLTLEQVTFGGMRLFVMCLKENHHITGLHTGRFTAGDLQQEAGAGNEARKQQGLPPFKLT